MKEVFFIVVKVLDVGFFIFVVYKVLTGRRR